MSEPDVFSQIRIHYNAFSKGKKKIAQYILDHPEQILPLSITQFAQVCGVGDASISRFCQSIGYKGYQDFKLALAQQVASTSLPGIEHLQSNSVQDTAQALLTRYKHILTETVALLDEAELQRATQALIDARQIVFFGVGSSLYTAMECCHKFMRITPNSTMQFDTHMQLMSAALLSEKDVAVVVSYSGATKETVRMAKIAKEGGARIIAVTRFLQSPLQKYADITLLCGADETILEEFGSSISIAQSFVLQMLYLQYFDHCLDRVQNNLKKTSSTLIDRMY